MIKSFILHVHTWQTLIVHRATNHYTFMCSTSHFYCEKWTTYLHRKTTHFQCLNNMKTFSELAQKWKKLFNFKVIIAIFNEKKTLERLLIWLGYISVVESTHFWAVMVVVLCYVCEAPSIIGLGLHISVYIWLCKTTHFS